jgi:hypothetical protein
MSHSSQNRRHAEENRTQYTPYHVTCALVCADKKVLSIPITQFVGYIGRLYCTLKRRLHVQIILEQVQQQNV